MNKQVFIENTKGPQDFTIVHVAPDGSCLYRTMIRFLVDFQKHFYENPHFYKIFSSPDIKEGGASKNLQEEIKNWIVLHRHDWLDSYMNFEGTIEDLLLMDHEHVNSVEMYEDLYSIYAGDDNFFYDKNEKNGKMEKIYIPSRWGGLTELYAFHKMFDIKIEQWICKKWNHKKRCIEDCDIEKCEKQGRYQLLQRIGNEEEEDKIIMNILYFDNGKNYSRHYVYLREYKEKESI